MNWTKPLDFYCERHGPGFWGEPLNAATNIAFWVAAWVCWRHLLRCQRAEVAMPSAGGYLLIGGLLIIGVASFLYHTFAQPWAAMGDVGSIVSFVLTYLYLQCRAVFGLRRWVTGLVLAGFVGLSMLGGRLSGDFLGVYTPTLLALVGLSTWNLPRQPGAARLLMVAAAVFAVSMVLAALDGALCGVNPLGTHWLWHLCNATALTLGTMALFEQMRN